MGTLDELILYFYICLLGVKVTLQITVFAFLLGTAIGVPLLMLRTYGGRIGEQLVESYEKLLRGVPIIIIMMLFYFGIGYRIPLLKSPFVSATLALGIRSGAYQSQIFRGAMRGIGEDQMMAGRSLGLSQFSSFRHVLLPQMLIIATAGLGSEYAMIVKDTAYAFFLGLAGDIMYQTKTLRMSRFTNLPFIPAALIYIMLTFPIATYLDRWGGKKKKELGI